jgi:hypothetical protein
MITAHFVVSSGAAIGSADINYGRINWTKNFGLDVVVSLVARDSNNRYQYGSIKNIGF